MSRTKYIMQRIERLETALQQPAVKNRYLRKIIKPIIKDWLFEIRSYGDVEFRQKNVEGLYAKTKRKKPSFG